MNRLTLAAWAVCLGAAVVAAVLWRDLRVEQQRHAVLQARVAALETGSIGLPAAAVVVPSATSAPAPAAPQPAPGSPAVAPTTPAAGSLAAAVQEMINTPGGQEFQRVMLRQSLAAQYPDLQKELGLSPAQADRLLDLLVKQRVDIESERARIARDGSLDRAAREAQGRRLAEKEQAYQREIATLLGDKNEAWNEYQSASSGRQRQRWERQGVEELRSAISTASNPLSPAMFDPLVKALDGEQKKIDQELRGVSAAGQVQRIEQDQQRLMNVASAYLNADQMQRYRRHLDGRAQMMRAMIGMIEQSGTAQAPAPATRP